MSHSPFQLKEEEIIAVLSLETETRKFKVLSSPLSPLYHVSEKKIVNYYQTIINKNNILGQAKFSIQLVSILLSMCWVKI